MQSSLVYTLEILAYVVPIDLKKVLEMHLAKPQRRWQKVNAEQVEIWQEWMHSGSQAVTTVSDV